MNTTSTNPASATSGCGDNSVATVIATALGIGSSAMVIFCRRGSGSFTERPETIVISTPSSATVSGCPVALVSRNSASSAVANAPVVRLAVRSRTNPGSDPIAQLRPCR